jgi:methylated-DNA-protein-cysteine methyltransferase-like protein
MFEKIKEFVAQIPRGKVSTYGAVAKAIGMRDARKVGWAIYKNQDPNVPCHRVVAKNGNLAEKFSLGGWEEQRSRLEADGIVFTKEESVDLEIYFWDGFKVIV